MFQRILMVVLFLPISRSALNSRAISQFQAFFPPSLAVFTVTVKRSQIFFLPDLFSFALFNTLDVT